jgi:uncharacterized protein (DUF58 family)
VSGAVSALLQRRGVRLPGGAWLRARTAQWMRHRQGPDQLPVRLARRRLYIVPTRAGMAFAALLLLMLLAGLNYGNSVALLLTFVLIGFTLVVMQQCHRNLLGTELLALSAAPVFAGGCGQVQLTLASGGGGARLRLTAALPHSPQTPVDLPPDGTQCLELPLPAPTRGLVRLERLRLATAHPFGLFRAWTWVHTPIEMLVYPQPRGSLPLPAQAGVRRGAQEASAAGTDEWAGLRPFRDGDSPRHVDWKAYARGAPLLVKEYTQGAAELRDFDFSQLPLADPEARLSQLARWVVDAEAHGERYGLTLPGVRLAAARGPGHRHRCLAALALFGIAQAP